MGKTKIICCALLFLLVAFAGGGRASARETIKVAPGGPIAVDGRIEEDEWRDASQYELAGGGKVFFKHDGEHLHVGVRGLAYGWSHLYFSQGDNREIWVMHASAALGMSVYRAGENKTWQPANPFAWDLRDRAVAAETRKKMSDHLAKNFWVANNNNMGARSEIEFRLRPRKLSDKAIRLAVVYASEAKSPQFFPAALRDDTLKEELVRGNTPPDLKFDLGQWASVSLERKKK